MSAKVFHLLPIGRAIADLVNMYEEGKIKGIVAVAKLKDDGYAVLLTDTLSCIEKLSLIEAAKIDIIGNALEVL